MFYENVPSIMDEYRANGGKAMRDAKVWSVGAFIALKVLSEELEETGTVSDETLTIVRQTLAVVSNDTLEGYSLLLKVEQDLRDMLN